MPQITTDPTPSAYRAQLEVQLRSAEEAFDKADAEQVEAYWRHEAAVRQLPTYKALEAAEAEARRAISEVDRLQALLNREVAA